MTASIARQLKSSTKVLMLGLMSILLGSCTSVKQVAGDYVPFYTYEGNGLDGITIQAAVDSNRDLPVAIDFIFISDPAVTELLTKMSGPDWFSKKQSILFQHAQTVAVLNVEIVPFTAAMPLQLPEDYNDAHSILMFANYLSKEGQFVADVTQYTQLRVTLGRNSYKLEELDP